MSTAYSVAEAFRRPCDINDSFANARLFYASYATIVAIATAIVLIPERRCLDPVSLTSAQRRAPAPDLALHAPPRAGPAVMGGPSAGHARSASTSLAPNRARKQRRKAEAHASAFTKRLVMRSRACADRPTRPSESTCACVTAATRATAVSSATTRPATVGLLQRRLTRRPGWTSRDETCAHAPSIKHSTRAPPISVTTDCAHRAGQPPCSEQPPHARIVLKLSSLWRFGLICRSFGGVGEGRVLSRSRGHSGLARTPRSDGNSREHFGRGVCAGRRG
jgi:hypothetical protein